MATGSGCSALNEVLSTIGVPGIHQKTFTTIEHEIGDVWKRISSHDIEAAGAEERRLAIERNDFNDGVPTVTVVADGGWSKRSHKHTYNALGGVGIIIGQATGKILHIGVRNKSCYICTIAAEQKKEPQKHECFKNWTESSQAMEADVIVEGFQQAEKVHGLRYMRLIADGDSSVYARIQEEVPVWGCRVTKVECSNHATKCLRSSLEKLVSDKPHLKGRNKLTKAEIIRLTTGVRCAIRMRSAEPDRKLAVRKLEKDIRNSVHHVFGHHNSCSSDFCKNAGMQVPQVPPEMQKPTQKGEDVSDDVDITLSHIIDSWSVGSTVAEEEESRLAYTTPGTIDQEIIREVSVPLNRLACKSDRLLGNFTTNVAENWMGIRMKFDGGKIFNRCHRGSWAARCYGGSLRKNLGTSWSTIAWEKAFNTDAGPFAHKLYQRRNTKLAANRLRSQKLKFKKRRMERKHQLKKESKTRKAKLAYGEGSLEVAKDIEAGELEKVKEAFYRNEVVVSADQVQLIERNTKDQSLSRLWKEERRKRLTSSSFGSIMSRKPTTAVAPFVTTLLYSSFRGNRYTAAGLREESSTIEEYVLHKADRGEVVSVEATGLRVSSTYPFLAASTDGIVTDKSSGTKGLLEVKNVLLRERTPFQQAARKSQFCLSSQGKSLKLKKKHKFYYQCQGQLNIFGFDWLDFVVRRTNPYQLHVERILPDDKLWHEEMVPKFKSFFFSVLLPELANPRYGKYPGIREPGIWYKRTVKKPQEKGGTEERSPEPGCSQWTSTSHVPQPSTSNVRKRRPHFLGRRISHSWIVEEQTGKTDWFDGTVVDVVEGTDGIEGCVYRVAYDSEEDEFDVDHLVEDFAEGSVRFIDI